MSKSSLFLFVLVPILNICLNVNVQKTATKASSFGGAVFSANFIFSFLIGTLSVFSLLALYLKGVDLARGILLMGAISIVGGSFYGVIFHRNSLNSIEWFLLAVITVLLSYRWSIVQ